MLCRKPTNDSFVHWSLEQFELSFAANRTSSDLFYTNVQVLCTDFDVAGELFADFEFLGVNLDDFSMQILVGKSQWQTEH